MSSVVTTPRETTRLLIAEPGKMTLKAEALRELKSGEFMVETLYSGVSAGTELTFFTGTNPKAHELFDPELRVFRPARDGEHLTDEYPVLQGGLEVGRVVASETEKVPVGTLISGVYGHQSAHILHEDDYYIVLPDNLDPVLGIFVAKMGPICANGTLFAADDLQRERLVTLRGGLAGQRVLVYGAGVVGLLSGLLAKWAGASDVVIVDSIQERLNAAGKLGLTPLKAAPNLPGILKQRWTSDNPLDRGADYVFQCTGSDQLLSQAFEVLREQGTVVDLGFYQTGAANVQLGREFHHNNLRHICAQIGTQPRHQQPRWNRRALAMETIQFLQEYGPGIREYVITHLVGFDTAQSVYNHLQQRDPSIMQVVLQPRA